MTALTLRNCEFAFQCTANWDSMDLTADDQVRICDACNKEVHRCDTNEELLEAIQKNLCVAIQAADTTTVPVRRRMLSGSMRAVRRTEDQETP